MAARQSLRTPLLEPAELWALLSARGITAPSATSAKPLSYPQVSRGVVTAMARFGELGESNTRDMFEGLNATLEARNKRPFSADTHLSLWLIAQRVRMRRWERHWQAYMEDVVGLGPAEPL